MTLHLSLFARLTPSLSVGDAFQGRSTICGEVLEGGAGGRLHQAALQRDPPSRRAAAELQRPRPPLSHRDGHAGRRDQPEAEAGGSQLLRPGEILSFLVFRFAVQVLYVVFDFIYGFNIGNGLKYCP